MFNRSHGEIHAFLELCSVYTGGILTVLFTTFGKRCCFFFFKMQQKRRAKQREEYFQSRDDELEFSRVPYSDPKQKRASARDGN